MNIQFKVGDKVLCTKYPNEVFTIKRIDNHVYPICIDVGIRVQFKDLVLVKEVK